MRTGVRDRGVITDHLEFGQRVLHGQDLYAPYLDAGPLHPVYPPGFGLLTAPFSLLPERLARIAWGALQVLALWAIGLWLRDALEWYAPDKLHLLQPLLLVTALLGSRYILRDTHGGGGNLINLGLTLSAFRLGPRRPMTAACLLGLSLATKPTHLLMVPLLWWLGQRRTATTAVAVAAGWTGASLLLLRHGWAPLQRWLDGSLAYARMEDLFSTPALGFPPFSWMNQCLRCAITRFAGEVPPQFAEQVPGFFAGLGLEPTATAWISRAASLLLLTTTILIAWRRRNQAPWLIAAVAALSTLLSPISWKAHHVALLPAFFLLAARAATGTRWLIGVLLAYAALCLIGGDLLGHDLKNTQQSLYLVTAGTLTLWALCLTSTASRATEHPPATGNIGNTPPPEHR